MSLVGLRHSPGFPVLPRTLSFLQRLPEWTQPHKPHHTIFWAGGAHMGETRGKDRVRATGSENTLSSHKLTCRQMENKMTRWNYALKWSHFDPEKQSCCHYCELVLSLEIRGSVPPANAGRGPAKCSPTKSHVFLPAEAELAAACLVGSRAQEKPGVDMAGAPVSTLHVWLRRIKLKRELGKLVTSAI